MYQCYFVDLQPERKSVSISSVDSQPIKASPKLKKEKNINVVANNGNDSNIDDDGDDNSEDF